MKTETDFKELFFSPIECDFEEDKSYQKGIPYYIALAQAFSITGNSCLYILDYVEKKIVYFDHKARFLCGYSPEEIEQLGIDFFQKMLHPNDIRLFQKINDKGFEFFYSRVLPEDKKKYWANYDLCTISKTGEQEVHNFRFYPLVVNERGNMILCMVQISLSPFNQSGNFFICSEKEHKWYEYSDDKGKFVIKRGKLNLNEKKTLEFMSKGYTTKEMKAKTTINESTINYYKSSIYKKLGVKNANEAIYLYTLMGDYL